MEPLTHRRQVSRALAVFCLMSLDVVRGILWPLSAQEVPGGRSKSEEKAGRDAGEELKLKRRGSIRRDQPAVQVDPKDVPSVSPEASRDLVRTLTGSGQSEK